MERLDPAVYMRTNRKGQALYIGVTNNLYRRDWEHRNGKGGAFSTRYNLTRLIWYKQYSSVVEAIAEEKRLKGASRANKLALIQSMNPEWNDLGLDWHQSTQNPIASLSQTFLPSFEASTPRNDGLLIRKLMKA